MLDRGPFWTPAPGAWNFAAPGLTVAPVSGLHQWLVSGPERPEAVGFSGVASGPRYMVAAARDRWLVVSTQPLDFVEGFDDERGLAVSAMSDAYLVLDFVGPALADLLSAAMAPIAATPSASIVFAGLPCLGYRFGEPGRLRLHVETPQAATLASFLKQTMNA